MAMSMHHTSTMGSPIPSKQWIVTHFHTEGLVRVNELELVVGELRFLDITTPLKESLVFSLAGLIVVTEYQHLLTPQLMQYLLSLHLITKTQVAQDIHGILLPDRLIPFLNEPLIVFLHSQRLILLQLLQCNTGRIPTLRMEIQNAGMSQM